MMYSAIFSIFRGSGSETNWLVGYHMPHSSAQTMHYLTEDNVSHWHAAVVSTLH